MVDLIDKQAAIDAVENAFDRETILNRFMRKIAISAIRLLPSAGPEIVMCEDCRHNGSFDTDCPIKWAGKEYCSFGESIEDGRNDQQKESD
jgi:hypothetical protein